MPSHRHPPWLLLPWPRLTQPLLHPSGHPHSCPPHRHLQFQHFLLARFFLTHPHFSLTSLPPVPVPPFPYGPSLLLLSPPSCSLSCPHSLYPEDALPHSLLNLKAQHNPKPPLHSHSLTIPLCGFSKSTTTTQKTINGGKQRHQQQHQQHLYAYCIR